MMTIRSVGARNGVEHRTAKGSISIANIMSTSWDSLGGVGNE